MDEIKYNLLQQDLSLCLKQDTLYSNIAGVHKAEFIISVSVIFRIIDKTLISQ